MKDKIRDLLFNARWGITKGIDNEDYSALDYSADKIIEAKALIAELDEPERPDKQDNDINDIENYEPPKFNTVKGVRYKTRGSFRTKNEMPLGPLIHYTVSGRTAKSAQGVVRYMAKKGLGCVVMDENADLWIPEGYDPLRDVVYHAGSSSWRGRKGISFYTVGLEVCCWGKDPRGSDRRESKGEANIKKGSYQKYTEAQEAGIKNFTLWVSKMSKDFDPEWIVGHDEVAPNRKSDPGASLSMTMPRFREMIKKVL